MRQNVWKGIASALVAVTVIISPLGQSAAVYATSTEEKLAYTQLHPSGGWTQTEDMRPGAPLGAELPVAGAVEAGIAEPQQVETQQSTPQQSTRSTYSMAYLNSLPYEELVNVLASIEWHQIPELFKYNEDTRRFYADEARFQAIVDGLEESGRRFTAENHQGIPTLVEVLRSGYYLGYYNQELNYLDQSQEKVLPALKAITENPNFNWGTPVQSQVINSAGKMISNSTVTPEIINNLTGVIERFTDHADEYGGDRAASEAYYSLLQGIGYVLMWRTEPAQEAAFKGVIDPYLEQLFRMAKNGPKSPEKLWLTSNAIYYSGSLAQYYSDPRQVNRVLTDVMQTVPKLSELYFVAAEQIEQHFSGTDADNRRIDMAVLKQQGKEYYLPQRFEFDDGQFVFQTGDKLSKEQIERLYWAAKEVQAQFYRVIGNDQALEQGNTDDVLTVVIYNNPDEYRMNRHLYGYETENGGIYIEGDGTFFTYDRTIEQSIYSLEELFRHEFTHYLQGRYEVPGMWGRGPLYSGGRMQWFDEGGAEFFAGATRTEGIQPRKSVVGNLRYDSPERRMSVSDTVNAQYGSWNFYNYAFALYDYLYQNDFTTLDRIHDAIRLNDARAYEDVLTAMSSDASLNEWFQRDIDEQVASYDNLTVPLVADDYLRMPEPKQVAEIYEEITSAARLSNVSTQERNSDFFRTFELRGTYTGAASKGEMQDWQTMNRLTDDLLLKLTDHPWDGYKTVTAYFTNYRVDGNGRFVYDLVFHGKLSVSEDSGNEGNEGSDGNKGDDGSKQSNTDQEPNDSWEQAVYLDAKGTVVSGTMNDTDRMDVYRFDVKQAGDWMIDLQTEQKRSVAWLLYHESDMNNYAAYPTHMEGTSAAGSIKAMPGTYYLFVYTIAPGEQPYRVLVQPGTLTESETQPEAEPVNPPFEESEPNDKAETANGPVALGRTITGALTGEDYHDIFAIDVSHPSELHIELEQQVGDSANWMLFREGDMEHPVSYPNTFEDNRLSSDYEAASGRYYVYVYNYGNKDVHYTLQIQ